MNSVNTEEIVEAYLTIRNQRDKILREYEAQDALLKEDLKQLEVTLLSVCNSINVDSIRTKHGTVMRKLNERFFCEDWDNFRKFVLDNEALELLRSVFTKTTSSSSWPRTKVMDCHPVSV